LPWHLNSPPCQQETAPRWGKAYIKKFKELIKQGKISIFDNAPATIEAICQLVSGVLDGNFAHALRIADALVYKAKKAEEEVCMNLFAFPVVWGWS
jgi:hypothetical protein